MADIIYMTLLLIEIMLDLDTELSRSGENLGSRKKCRRLRDWQNIDRPIVFLVFSFYPCLTQNHTESYGEYITRASMIATVVREERPRELLTGYGVAQVGASYPSSPQDRRCIAASK